MDRKKLGRRVFADPAERCALEALVFPFIMTRLKEQIAAARQDRQVEFVILDAAIMLEAGWNNVCDSIVYIHAPRAVRLQRLAQNRGWTALEVAAREQAQMPLTDKATRADAAIDNSGPPEAVARRVVALLDRLGIRHRQNGPELR